MLGLLAARGGENDSALCERGERAQGGKGSGPVHRTMAGVGFMVAFLPAYDAHGRARGSFESDKVLFAERDKAGGVLAGPAAYHMVNDADAQNLRGFDQAAGDVAILLAGRGVA